MAKDIEPENYIKNPVEGFGKKIFEKLGWYEGRGVGKNSQGEIPIHFNAVPRSERKGLGATDEMESEQKRKFEIGTKVKIIEGKHKGIRGVVADIVDMFVFIELPRTVNQIRVKTSKVVKYEENENSEANDRSTRQKKLRWVMPGLRVRVRSQKVCDGSLYNSKVIINDVLDKYSFTALLRNQRIITNLTEKDIETVIPSLNEPIMILKGTNRGEVANLIERDRKRNKVKVQLINESPELIEYTQDDVCEFVKLT
ncbi:unnamed protein product [Blepharisma stoltei]|uniref:G-patch domain-containing protein n=1 Tax=Blepharisma stoltei TaxID=1481888 RepID=A0AAU9K4Y5_9CILI|nr:unnamed protein product [Blepharisma stoltei]